MKNFLDNVFFGGLFGFGFAFLIWGVVFMNDDRPRARMDIVCVAEYEHCFDATKDNAGPGVTLNIDWVK